MNITEKKWIQTCGYQWEREVGRGEVRGGSIEVQSTMYEINKLQACIVQHRL